MAKVDKLNAPLLVVGLGGTGADGLLRVKSLFQQRLNPEIVNGQEQDHPPRTAFLAVDTDENILRKRYHGVRIDRDSEFFSIRCDTEYVLGDESGSRVNAYCSPWLDPAFYTNPALRAAAHDGAGTFRQLARMMLFYNASTLHGKLASVLHQLAALPAGARPGDKRINVVVITGFSGGTGSGTFLDFAYLMRHAASQENVNINLELYVLTPDIFVNKLPETHRVTCQANGFAALKELDYWMDYDSRQVAHVPGENYAVQYASNLTVMWNGRPYDDVTLLCGSNIKGVILQRSYEVALDAVAQMLLFIMAGEAAKTREDIIGEDHTTADDTYTFQSAKSNEQNFILQVPRNYPQYHGYRSIGAFSNLSEQENKIVIETSMLLTDLASYLQSPGRKPVMEGRDPEEFCQPIQDRIQSLSNEIIASMAYPEEIVSGTGAYSRQTLRGVDPSLAPHNVNLPEWQRTVTGERPHFSELMRKEIMDAFRKHAEAYVAGHGPEALQTMLTDPNTGFLTWIRNKAESYRTGKINQLDRFNNLVNTAADSFTKFQTAHPLFGALDIPHFFQDYGTQMREAFDAYQMHIYYGAGEEALTRVRSEIQTSILDGSLRNTINALDELKRESANAAGDTQTDAAAPGHADDIRQAIKGVFEDEHVRDDLRAAVLAQIGEVAVMNGLDVDTASEEIRGRISAVLSRTFLTINSMTLQDELAHITTGTVREYALTEMGPSLERGAQVLFANHPNYPVNVHTAVVLSFISVPRDQTEVKGGIRDFVSNNHEYNGSVFKNSLVDDQVFWLNVVSGLPLCAYSFLAEYEKVYEENRSRYGIHLLMAQEDKLQMERRRRSIQNDWFLLPSPNPFMIFHETNAPINEKLERRWNDTMARLQKVEDSGIISIDCTNPDGPVCKIRMFIEDGRLMQTEALKARVDAVIQSATSAEDRLEKLQALQNDQSVCRVYEIKDPHQTQNAAENLVLQINAFKGHLLPTVPEQKERIFRTLSYWILSRRPELVQALEEQMELGSVLQSAINEASAEIEELKKQRESIRMVAQLYLFERLQNKLSNILYLNERDEVQTAGERNILFERDNYWAKDELWSNYIPLMVRMVEWYAAQDRTLQPFASIEAKVKELMEQANNLEDTEADIAKARALYARSEELAKDMENKIIDFKIRQKELPKKVYDRALFIMNELVRAYRGLGAAWMGI